MIDVLVPVLGRPQNVRPLLDSLSKNTEVPYRVIFICSEEDEEQFEACVQAGEFPILCPWVAGRSDYAKKMNLGFHAGENAWVFLGADDIEFLPGWDTEALRAAEHKQVSVVGINDQVHPDVRKGLTSTHPLVSRRYITEQGGAYHDPPGTLIHEGYDHNYSERELVALAQLRQEWTFARRACIRHNHPIWRRGKWDDTYQKGTLRIPEDYALFLSRAAQWGGIGLMPRERATMSRYRRQMLRTR